MNRSKHNDAAFLHPVSIDLFKIDIEGSEFGVVSDLLALYQRRFSKHDASAAFPHVGQLQMEMHIRPDKYGLQFAFYTILQLAAQGFLLTKQERNPWYGHCME